MGTDLGKLGPAQGLSCNFLEGLFQASDGSSTPLALDEPLEHVCLQAIFGVAGAWCVAAALGGDGSRSPCRGA